VDSVFTRAMTLRPPRILGVRLRAFSCWHALVLLTLGNPFLVGGRMPNWGDLVELVCVCSDSWGDDLKTFGRFSVSPLRRFVMFLRCMVINRSKAFDIAWAYLDAFCDFPEIVHVRGKERPSGAPWPYHLVAYTLREHGGITRAEAWDMSVIEAGCLKACNEEANGAILELAVDEMVERDTERAAAG